jgi:1-acyl-sn-glycerol-3-phosphate acyltransferase
MSQEQGVVGRLVGVMLRRSVRQRFHSVRWTPPTTPLQPPVIFYANHHGWMDGYLMFHLVSRLGIPCLDWIEEFDAFPLFRFVGGVRYPKGDVNARVRAVRQTIRAMVHEGKSLVIFPEGVLHRPPGLLPFGRAMGTVARNVPRVTMVPVAIRYELSMHERPEAWLTLGQPHGWTTLEDCTSRVSELLASPWVEGEILVQGTADVNERMDMRRMPGNGKVR